MSTKVNESQIYARVAGIDGTWAVVSEVTTTAPRNKIADGGAPEETNYGKKSYSDMTLSRPYDSARDPAIVKDLITKAGRFPTTIMVFTTDPDDVLLDTMVWRGGLGDVTTPRGDRASNNPASVQIVCSIDGPANG